DEQRAAGDRFLEGRLVQLAHRGNLQAPAQRAEPQPRHLPDRLEDDGPAHLRASLRAVAEDDRHLDDAEALAAGAERRLDLKDVAGGVDVGEVDRLEDAAAEALEASGR